MTDIKEHSLLPGLKEQLGKGQMDRREFIRFAALLGVGASAAYAMAGLPSPALAADSLPFPPADPAAKAGGTLRVGQIVAKMEDPATYSWNEMSNQSRPIIEYMTMVGPDNIVRPMLIEAWEPSADLKTWTLHVRKGVMWHNGEELTADHIAWNIRRWTDSANGSSNLGLSTFGALAEATGDKDAKGKPVRKPARNGVEVVGSHTLRLNLSKPVLSVAEDCAEYPALIVHPSFKAPFSDHPIGTGPYTLAELKVGERCVLKRVAKTTDGKDFRYWGGDVYLDEIHFYNYEQDNQTAALASGSVDAIYELTVEQLELARSIDGAQILSVETAQTLCCRMQVDAKPFDDIRVRRAIVKAVDNAAVKALVFPEGGGVAYNFHVAPVHPDYFPLPELARDVEGAKQLLKEAGYEKGLDLTIDVGNTDGPWHQAVCEALRDQLKDVGINLAVNVMPTTKFWEVWDKTPFGATSWAHRPLGTMALAQAYRTGVPWNESHFSDPEFDKALSEAEATIDVAERKAKMEKVERILQDAAVMVEPLWRPVYNLASAKVHGYKPHPARQMQLTKVWMS
ncbi:ABC transporter substrate-binding protein [Labrys wisconsinensis]|uniref:Peptide/nickel transport system substrate-binding protein n=1 Tax=Labrys wisconsinensis TaxID=425677 RepID=A0ABU0JJC0_9HYPH|nr:ABC transporter substrate-binding protein [Labrys wisconsinensis]MDQ0474370.1 peptide/nickel transport system substrate-binding protein [Labrys wisconsinensis]